MGLPRQVVYLIGTEDGLGLTAHQILVLATSDAAGILGPADAGVPARGRRADLVPVDGDPLRGRR
jgi:imidazolonepropionase-like amidohydrolase